MDISAAKPGKGTRIPYAAVLYDPNGDTWAFVNRKPLTYVRESITVDRIDGDVAFLTAAASEALNPEQILRQRTDLNMISEMLKKKARATRVRGRTES